MFTVQFLPVLTVVLDCLYAPLMPRHLDRLAAASRPLAALQLRQHVKCSQSLCEPSEGGCTFQKADFDCFSTHLCNSGLNQSNTHHIWHIHLHKCFHNTRSFHFCSFSNASRHLPLPPAFETVTSLVSFVRGTLTSSCCLTAHSGSRVLHQNPLNLLAPLEVPR